MRTAIAILACLLAASGAGGLILTQASAQSTPKPAPAAAPGCRAERATFRA